MIAGEVDLRSYARDFEGWVLRRGRDVLRADRIFLDSEGRTALVEALVVEAGRKLSFYVKISAHERGTATVRIDPMTHPERSAGVKQLVARLGADLLRHTPGARVEVTNLVLPSASEASEGGAEP